MYLNRIITGLSNQIQRTVLRAYTESAAKKDKFKMGHAAVVTGASMGIGLNAVESLLEAGVMNIFMSDIDAKTGEKELSRLRRCNPKACLCFAKCDTTKCEEVKELFDSAIETYGYVDILVNNAGIFNEAIWATMVDINLKGTISGLNLAMAHMSKERGGRGGAVINLASILGLQQLAGAPVYVATKHGVIGLTRSYGEPWHWDRSGVRVMAICPGVTMTPLIAAANKVANTPLAKEAAKGLGSLPKQDVCHCGLGMVHMLKNGDSGSIWVSEDSEFYEVKIPERQSLRVK